MIGIVIAIIIILVLGLGIVFRTLELRTTTSSEAMATDLALLADTVQAAPEPISFSYYTEIIDDYPAIGSLEIDDDAGILCVSPKSEQEIFSTVVDRASGQAGFAAVAYTVAKARSEFKRRAAGTELAEIAELTGQGLISEDQRFNYLMSAQDPQSRNFRTAMLDPANDDFFGTRGAWLRNRDPGDMSKLKRVAANNFCDNECFKLELSKLDLTDAKAQKLGYANLDDASDGYRKMLTRSSLNDITDDLSKRGPRALATKHVVRNAKQLQVGILHTNMHTGQELKLRGQPVGTVKDFVEKSMPTRKTWASRIKFWFFGGKQTLKEALPFTKARKAAKGFERAGNRIASASGRFPGGKTKVGRAIFLTAIVTYGLTQDDFKASSLAMLPIVAGFFKDWGVKYMLKRTPQFLIKAGIKVTAGESLTKIKAGLFSNPFTAGFGAGIWLIETGINLADAAYTMVVFDSELLAIRAAADTQLNEEKRLLVCKEFSTSNKPLLYPANCVPKITYSDVEAQIESRSTQTAKDRLGDVSGSLAPITQGFDQMITADLGTLEGIGQFLDGLLRIFAGILSAVTNLVGQIVANIGSALGELLEFKIPRPDCEITDDSGNVLCDQVYERRDCPNYFISQFADQARETENRVFSMGRICLGAVGLEWGYDVCSIIQLVGTLNLYISQPEDVQAVEWHLYDLGLGKNVGQKQVAFANFSDNQGYWYAEFPAVIEFTKVYNETDQFFIISKAA